MAARLVLPAIALALAAPVVAQPTSVSVPYGDLDLTKAAGRDALERRLTRAAHQVCGTYTARDLATIRHQKACVAETRESYRPQVEVALNAANARRVAGLAQKIGLLASF
ncbi:UrcA family protein [Erythrobacter sp. NFXS35]|uniref:UrcA family protein n=1 Tax=Erythrobacter sp. NFXS35 TaxID=2818436 RepID=UPI0032DE38DB